MNLKQQNLLAITRQHLIFRLLNSAEQFYYNTQLHNYLLTVFENITTKSSDKAISQLKQL